MTINLSLSIYRLGAHVAVVTPCATGATPLDRVADCVVSDGGAGTAEPVVGPTATAGRNVRRNGLLTTYVHR